MAQLRRCAEGHVFDTEKFDRCPVCGSPVELSSDNGPSPAPGPVPGRQPPWLLAGAGAGLVVAVVGIAVWQLAGHHKKPVNPPIEQTTTTTNKPTQPEKPTTQTHTAEKAPVKEKPTAITPPPSQPPQKQAVMPAPGPVNNQTAPVNPPQKQAVTPPGPANNTVMPANPPQKQAIVPAPVPLPGLTNNESPPANPPPSVPNNQNAILPPSQQPPPPASNKVIYADDFQTMAHGWGRPSRYNFVKASAMFIIPVANRNYWMINDDVHVPRSKSFTDIRTQMSFYKPSGSSDGGGLIFWAKGPNDYYIFVIGHMNQYAVFQHVGGKWRTVIGWTSTSVIRSNKQVLNQIDVVERGDEAYFLINGVRVGVVLMAEPPGSPPTSGDLVGLYCERGEAANACGFPHFAVMETSDKPPAQAPDGTVVYSDPFDTMMADWGRSNRHVFVKDGAMQIVSERNRSRWQINESLHTLRITSRPDIRAQVTLPPASVAKGDGGIIFGAQDAKNYYVFLVDNDGRFSVFQHTNGKYRTLIDWTALDFIKTVGDNTNRLDVVELKHHTYFLIDGTRIAEIKTPPDRFVDDIAGLWCGSKGKTSVTCRFPQMTVQAAPSTPPAGPRAGTLLYLEDFKTLSPNWGEANENMFVKNGALQIVAAADASRWQINGSLQTRIFAPAATRAEINFPSNVPATSGLIFWANDVNKYFLFDIDSSGRFAVLRYEDKKYKPIIPWTHSAAIKTGKGAANQLEMLDADLKAYLSINGTSVGEVKSPSSDPGMYIGFYCESLDKTKPATCRYPRITITSSSKREIAAQAAPPTSPPTAQ